jgi:hypothetical protein
MTADAYMLHRFAKLYLGYFCIGVAVALTVFAGYEAIVLFGVTYDGLRYGTISILWLAIPFVGVGCWLMLFVENGPHDAFLSKVISYTSGSFYLIVIADIFFRLSFLDAWLDSYPILKVVVISLSVGGLGTLGIALLAEHIFGWVRAPRGRSVGETRERQADNELLPV